MLTLARECAGLTQSALAKAMNVSQPLLSQAENGFKDLSAEVLARAAPVLDVPIEFFDQLDPVIGEGVVDILHRKRQTLPATARRRAHALGNRIRLELGRLFRSFDLSPKLPYPAFSDGTFASPVEAARLVRAAWRIPDGPMPNMVESLELCGTPVIRTNLGHQKLSAFSMPGPADAPSLVLINDQLTAAHERWSMAHEIGHLVMHSQLHEITPGLEDDADLFAGELLLPERELKRYVRASIKFHELGQVKRYWSVSLAALIKTSYHRGLIDDGKYRWFNVKLNQLPGGRYSEPGDVDPEEPHLVRSMIDAFLGELGHTMGQLAELMVTSEHHIRRVYLGELVARPLRVVPRH